MAVAVQQFQRAQEFRPEKEEKVDPLDQLLKGLQIASAVYGIKHGIDQNDIVKAKYDFEKTDAPIKQEIDLKDKGLMKGPDGSIQYDPNSYKQQKANADLIEANKKALKDAEEKIDTPEQAIKKKLDLDLKTAQLESLKNTMNEKTVKAEKAKTVEGKIANLNSTDKTNYDKTRMALSAVKDMKKALSEGDMTVTLPGKENKYTLAAKTYEEAFGRLQSGGAISKEENKRFSEFRPSVFDSAEMQQYKLDQLEKEFSSRLSTYGISPQEAGIDSQPPQSKAQPFGMSPADAQSEAAKILAKRKGLSSGIPRGKSNGI